MTPVLELVDIHKRFGSSVALAGATLRIRPESVHAVLGENGAGKTTLMRMAFGLLQPDAGALRIRGCAVALRSPRDAIRHRIGMVHQHLTLVPAMTVAENIALGRSGHYSTRRAREFVQDLAAQTGISVEPDKRVRDLSVAARQRVEILKALSRDASILILDEPTAVLAPQESDELMSWLRRFADSGNSVVLITHKLREARAAADAFSVLRHGRTVLTGDAAELGDDVVVRAMVGEALGEGLVAKAPVARRPDVLRLEGVHVSRDGQSVLQQVSLSAHGGEILGIAAIEGSGQRELLRILAGRLPASGNVALTRAVAFIPEDRHSEALVLDMSLRENVALRGLGVRRGWINWNDVSRKTDEVLASFDVRAPSAAHPISAVSGGNQQKLVIGREFSPLPDAVVAENPTRGLDVRASADVHAHLRRARDAGVAVVVYSADIDELIAIADRVVVVHSGRVREVQVDREQIGRAMIGLGW